MTNSDSHSALQTTKGQSVLILSGVRGDTRRYRTFHPYEQLRLLGIPAVLSHITDPNVERYAQSARIMIVHRATYDPRVERIIRNVSNRGGMVLLDADDLTFWPDVFQWIDSPDFRDPVRAKLYREDLRRNHKTFALCHGMTASTDYLAGVAREMGKPAWVCRNAFNVEMLALSERAANSRKIHSDKVIIGYASGTPTHNRDFAMIAGAVQAVLRDHPECELWTIGPLHLDEAWRVYEKQIRQLPWVPWRELPGQLARFDINLAPLIGDNPFGQSKSEIKYVEAGLVRVPTIASPTDAFKYAIRSGENGYLADSTGEWAGALDALVCDAVKRRQMGEQAYRDVLARYHPQVRAQELVTVLSQASEQLTGRKMDFISHKQEAKAPENSIENAAWETHPTLFEMGMYNLRQRGIKTLFRQVRAYIRRLIAPIFPYR